MADNPLQAVHGDNGAPIGYVGASGNDPAMLALLSGIIQRAARIEALQHERREAIRAGTIPPCPWDATDRLYISDRD
jgi:hypothetical protein